MSARPITIMRARSKREAVGKARRETGKSQFKQVRFSPNRRNHGLITGWRFSRILSKRMRKHGRHEETRTPDLYRVNPARIGFSTSYKCVETA